jgi:hypothetical protein
MRGTPWRTGVEERSKNRLRGNSGRQVMHTTIPFMLTASDPLLCVVSEQMTRR